MAFDFNNNGQQRPNPAGGSGKPYRSTSGGTGTPPQSPSGGFGNRPVGTSGRTGTTNAPGTGPNPGLQPRRNMPVQPGGYRSTPYRGGGVGGFLSAIPWRIILPILLVVLAVALVIVFRNEITYFFSMLLSWAIMAGVAFLILRWIIRRLFR